MAYTCSRCALSSIKSIACTNKRVWLFAGWLALCLLCKWLVELLCVENRYKVCGILVAVKMLLEIDEPSDSMWLITVGDWKLITTMTISVGQALRGRSPELWLQENSQTLDFVLPHILHMILHRDIELLESMVLHLLAKHAWVLMFVLNYKQLLQFS